MPPDDDVRLRHLIDAAETAIRFARGRTRADLDNDEMLTLALTKLVEIVGEAAKQVTAETRRSLPEVPWSAAARMRDRLVHHYFDIDLDVLWSTSKSICPHCSRPSRPQGQRTEVRFGYRRGRSTGCRRAGFGPHRRWELPPEARGPVTPGTLGRTLRAGPEVLGQLSGAGVKHPLVPEAGHAGCDACESAQQRSLGGE